jgi:hypothetical protein
MVKIGREGKKRPGKAVVTRPRPCSAFSRRNSPSSRLSQWMRRRKEERERVRVQGWDGRKHLQERGWWRIA